MIWCVGGLIVSKFKLKFLSFYYFMHLACILGCSGHYILYINWILPYYFLTFKKKIYYIFLFDCMCVQFSQEPEEGDR